MIPLRNVKRFFYKALKQPGYAFRVASRRIGGAFSYCFGKGRSGPPEAITLFLTHRCNLHCKMCGQWGERGVTKKQTGHYVREELPTEELKKMINDVSAWRPNITLFGGEPLLYYGCIDSIKYIKQKKMHCVMITNGSLVGECADALVSAGLDELNVSLDAGGTLHEEIRGVPGVYEKIIGGLVRINQLKKSQRKITPLIHIQCTISKYNYMHLEQLLAAAGEAGADSLTFHNLIFLPQELIERQKKYDEILHCSSLDWEGFVTEPGIDVDELYKKIGRIIKGRHAFAVDMYPNFSYKALKEYYRNTAYVPSDYSCRCLSPWIAAYVFPDGQVRPCLNCNYSFGSIKENNFLDIWNSAAAIQYRRLLKENRIFPVCARCTELYRY